MFRFSRAGRFLLTGIFLLTTILTAHALDVVNNNSDGDGSLSWAVEQSNAGAGSVINISPSVKTLHLSRELTFTRSVTVTGSGALIDGEETRRLFRVTDGRVVFSGLAFTRGNAASGSGGAVEVDGSGASAEFVNCVFYGNKARDYGGAVCVTRGDELNPTIFRSCTITANTANSGGGLSVSSGTAHVFGSIVTGNSGDNDIHSAGGTIHTRYDLIGSTNIQPSDSDLTGQTASGVLVSENGVAKVETVGGIHLIRITDSSPAYNFVAEAQYSASWDMAGTARPQFGAYDAGAYEIPGTPITAASLAGVPYIMIGDTVIFSLDIYPEEASLEGVTWRSSDGGAVSADGGAVMALSSGSADIWAEVHGWDSQGRAVSVASNRVKVRTGEEAFTELSAEFTDVIADRYLSPGQIVSMTPAVAITVDQWELYESDGVGYTLEAESSRPEIVSA
ncbi:MAG: hypothetical protein IJG37_04465, partial [Synergistaceae bacterium]|nr:hypothetical protein [Synergistaceae bacterium]